MVSNLNGRTYHETRYFFFQNLKEVSLLPEDVNNQSVSNLKKVNFRFTNLCNSLPEQKNISFACFYLIGAQKSNDSDKKQAFKIKDIASKEGLNQFVTTLKRISETKQENQLRNTHDLGEEKEEANSTFSLESLLTDLKRYPILHCSDKGNGKENILTRQQFLNHCCKSLVQKQFLESSFFFSVWYVFLTPPALPGFSIHALVL